jgi:hypothetical protein
MARKKAQKNLVSRLADEGEKAIQKLTDVPGATKVTDVAQGLRKTVDEMQKRLRSLDPLEKRVRALEKRLDEVAPKRKPAAKRTAAAKKTSTTSRSSSSPRPKKPTS